MDGIMNITNNQTDTYLIRLVFPYFFLKKYCDFSFCVSFTPLQKGGYLLCSLVSLINNTSLRAMLNGRIKKGFDGHSGFENSAFRLNPQRGNARKTLGWATAVV